MAEIVADILTIKNDSVPKGAWPRLTCSEPNQLMLEDSSLKLGGQREVLFQNSGQLRAADDIRFLIGASASSEKLRILANGNVGIGVTNPGARLEVAGFIRATDGLESNAANKMRVGTRQAQPLELMTNNNAALTINAAGKVGIGTTTPTQKLEVSGNAKINNVFLGDVGHGAFWAGFSHNMQAGRASYALLQSQDGLVTLINKKSGGGIIGFRVDNADKMAILDNGNVGIGTVTPTQKLHVAGPFITVNGAGNEQVYMGGDGSGRDAQFGSLNPNINNVAFFNAANSKRMNIFANDIFANDISARDIKFSGNLQGGGKGGYVMDQFINNLDEALEIGDVVVVGPNQSSLFYGPRENIPIPEVNLVTEAYHTGVCGVICEVYGEPREQSEDRVTRTEAGKKSKKGVMRPQAFSDEEMERLDYTQVQPGQIGWMVTLGAFAHCKVDADIAPIKIGDLLTTSPTRGHAQKAMDRGKAVGAIIGKALGSLEKGKGKIPALVMLQ